MFVEQCTVSRKTPLDGKLEISPVAAERFAALGADVALTGVDGNHAARLISLECSCAKAAGSRHLHHFIESAALRSLSPGATVRLQLDETERTVRVDPGTPGVRTPGVRS